MDALDRRRRMRLGCDAFNRGAFFEAHEVWESVWVASDGPDRASIQGLIQLSVAFHKVEQGRLHVALRLFERALAKLERSADALDGLDLARLRRDSADALAVMGSGGRARLTIHASPR